MKGDNVLVRDADGRVFLMMSLFDEWPLATTIGPERMPHRLVAHLRVPQRLSRRDHQHSGGIARIGRPFDVIPNGIDLPPVAEPGERNGNVVGMIEGADPVLKNEYITIESHLDGAVGTRTVARPAASVGPSSPSVPPLTKMMGLGSCGVCFAHSSVCSVCNTAKASC